MRRWTGRKEETDHDNEQTKFFGVLLTLVLVLGLMPGMSLTAYAATDTYAKLIPKGADDAAELAAKVCDSTATNGTS